MMPQTRDALQTALELMMVGTALEEQLQAQTLVILFVEISTSEELKSVKTLTEIQLILTDAILSVRKKLAGTKQQSLSMLKALI
jgi:hypothetical protein